ncbi:GNAT family N-acetyltransferase, partial [Candidatus Thorarchaeota archaeon]
GQVVCVANLRVIDDGRTGWMEGIRVHPDIRSEGLGQKMTLHMLSQARLLGVQRVRLITATANEPAVYLAESAGLDRIATMGCFWKDDPCEIEWRLNKGSVSEIGPLELAETVKKHPGLVPSGVLIYHWDAVDADERGLAFASEHTRFWVYRRDGDVAAISTGLVFESPQGREWFATIYPSDKGAFLRSLSHHLSLSTQEGCEVMICIHPPRFSQLYEEEPVLAERAHELIIGLYERVLE